MRCALCYGSPTELATVTNGERNGGRSGRQGSGSSVRVRRRDEAAGNAAMMEDLDDVG